MHFACSEKSLQNGGSFSNSIRKIEAWSIIPHFFVFVLFNFFSAGLLTYTPLGPTAFHTIYLMSGDIKRFLAHSCFSIAPGFSNFQELLLKIQKKKEYPGSNLFELPGLPEKKILEKKKRDVEEKRAGETEIITYPKWKTMNQMKWLGKLRTSGK